MKFVNTVELKNHLNMLISNVSHGETVIVTVRGRPAATILPTTEEELDQIIFERSSVVRKAVQKGLQDLESGKYVTLKKYVSNRFGTHSKNT